MKKRTAALLGVFALTITLFAGCGKAETPAEPASNEENFVGMANPWVEITEEEADGLCERLFKAPEGATELVWQKCESLGDPEKNKGPLIQLNFKYDDMDFTARAQQGAAEADDISGTYADWAAGPVDSTLANWGGGNMQAKEYRAIDDTGDTDLITWYDIEIGIKYSLSVTAPDLDGFDIQGIVEQMFK